MIEIRRIAVSLANYPAGSRTFGPVDIPSRIDAVELRVARCTTATPTIWPSAAVKLALIAEGNFAGTWETLGGLEAKGGIAAYRGEERTESVLMAKWRADRDPTELRLRATVTGGTLRTSLLVIAYKLDPSQEIARGR